MGSGTGLLTRGGPCPLLWWPLAALIRGRGGGGPLAWWPCTGGPLAWWPCGAGPKAWWPCTGGPVHVVVTRPSSRSVAWWCGGKARGALGHYWGALAPSLGLIWGALTPSLGLIWGPWHLPWGVPLGHFWGALAPPQWWGQDTLGHHS